MTSKSKRQPLARLARGVGFAGALLVGVALPALASAAASNMRAPSPDPQNISGVWWTKTYTPQLRPLQGEVPLTAKGRERFEEYKRAFATRSFEDKFAAAGVTRIREYRERIKTGPIDGLKFNMSDSENVNIDYFSELSGQEIVDATLHKCLPAGAARLMAAPYPFRIVQTPKQVTFLFEMGHLFRIARMNAKHANPDIWDPTYTGEAVAHWEGDTLVIDTTNVNQATTLDRAGTPHSDQLHLTERLRKINGGRELEATITIEDPVMFTKPWSTRLVYEWRPDVTPRVDQVCDDQPRDISHLEGAPK